MKTNLTRPNVAAIVAIAMLTVVLCTGSAQAIEIVWPEPNWPEIFEPNQLRTLNLEMDPCDWLDICADGYLDGNETDLDYELEVPAFFWMDGEEDLKIRVAVRQKSCEPIPLPGYTLPDPIEVNNIDPNQIKISLKIDINQYYGVDPCAATDWHDLKKLSLENGDDDNALTEGVACNIHGMASGPEGYGYNHKAHAASWVKLYVNGLYRGVYVSQEQRDKQFMKHRNAYIHSETWLYKHVGRNEFVLKVGDDEIPKSPALDALCYEPFVCENPPDDENEPDLRPAGGVCSIPDDANVAADMNEWVNVQSMLAMAATNAFIANTDTLFSHYQNAWVLDFNLPDPCETRKRLYFPWDQDSPMNSLYYDIYKLDIQTEWMDVILDNQTLRSQYNQKMRDLLNGPLTKANINAFVDMIEPVVKDALAADPWNQIGGAEEVATLLGEIKTWHSNRIVNVLNQVWWDEPAGTVLMKDDFEGTPWNANWTGSWLEDTGEYCSSYTSAMADKNNKGDFTSDALDASDATALHVAFRIRKDFIDGGDFMLYYHNGTTDINDFIIDLDDLGFDKEWLHYTDVITDSSYFEADFKVVFNATPDDNKEFAWVDDVVVTKLTTTPVMPVISGYILDRKDAAIDGVLVSANNGGGSDTTDPNGYYEVVVPYGWSNSSQSWSSTVTPTKEDYTFDPPERTTYRNVVVDQLDQDYVGTSIYDLNPDGFIDFADLAECIPAAWLSSQGDGNWNAACDFYFDLTVNFKDFAKFGGAWEPQ